MKNCINITLKTDRIIIKINENAEQVDILECLRSKIPDLKKLYKDDKTPISVMGKMLKNKEIEEVQEVIKQAIDVDLEFDSPKVLGLHGIKRTFEQEIAVSETKFHRGALRSGQRIEYEGSLVVLGDVNGGAEVIAGENVVVLGHLRGIAHAGAKGNKQAIICAASIDAPQVRIANIVKEIEKDPMDIMKRHTYAYVQDDRIVLE